MLVSPVGYLLFTLGLFRGFVHNISLSISIPTRFIGIFSFVIGKAGVQMV